MKSKKIIENIIITLKKNEFDFQDSVNSMEHIKNIELRKKEKTFTFNEHIKALIYSC